MHSNKSRAGQKLSPQATFRFTFEAIGTAWVIEVHDPIDTASQQALQQEIATLIDAFDMVYSRFRPDSLVTCMATTAGRYKLPSDAEPLLGLYRRLYDLTGGAMTPLIGQVLADAGYDANYSLRPGTLHAAPAWDETLAYKAPYLEVKRPVLLDFGAAGKGYLVDIIGQYMVEQGIQSFCVNAGGDMVYRTAGPDRLRVGLEHPEHAGQAIGVATLRNQALCGSAGNRRAWGGYHHIIHPTRLESPRHIQALWVVAESALLADALTTALYFVEPKVLEPHMAFAYAVLLADGSVRYSADFPVTFFTDKETQHALH